MSAANDSSNSGASSNDSGNSSGQSGQSSGDSAKSSNGTANSSNNGGSSDSNASSKTSSQNTSRDSGNSSAVVSGVGLLVTTVAGIGVAIYATVRVVQQQAAQGKTAMRYLRSNGDQLKQDLAIGEGPALDDLAAAAEVRTEHSARFNSLLRAHRRELLELADPEKLTAERALTFLSRIGELAAADEVLREDVNSWLARHAEEG
ncbi:MAG: DUF3015 family protein [Myxococcaceae bacterium]